MVVKIIVLAIYALVIIIVGIYGLRKTRSFNDFFLGGGKVGAIMSAFSYGATYFSAVVFIGFAGKIGWGFGYSGIWIGVLNGLIGVLAVWALLGWRVKKMSVEMGVHTLSEYLEKRYGSPALKLIASIAIFIFLIPYSAAVFIGLSYLFASSFEGLQYWHAVLFMGVFTAIYIVLGGYKSMAMMDTVFGIIMTTGVLVLFGYTLNAGGGLAAITEKLQSIDPGLTATVGPPGWWPLLSLILLTSVAPFAMPQLMQKFYAIKDRKAIRTGMIASTIFALLIGGIAYFLGSTTRIFLAPETSPAAFTAEGKPVFDALMPELLARVIPESLSIIILLIILAASMSTLASLVLISSSSFCKDFYAGFINRNVTDKQLTNLMRGANLFFVLLSVILALIKPSTIVTILAMSWGAIGSAFLGPFIWGLFWKRTTRLAAFASMLLGLGTCIGLSIAGFGAPEAGTIGMGVSLAVPPVVSWAGGRQLVLRAKPEGSAVGGR
ncbi:MAG TPA: sodium:solute symporter family protein [Bacteroidales bacterium]|nr:sodium:solute symporter family protein [Bacteroidales bacterium]HPI86232.1 sodium:solute symporter family protein [Bacteroidales bacterium]HPM91488.1 sodium:solute symporter family protein [Bacteroidales bacterium]